MKIYLSDLKLSEPLPTKKISILDKKTSIYYNIYSSDGLYRLQKESVYKLFPFDIFPEKLEYQGIELIVDKSKHIFRKEPYHIPYEHVIEKVTQVEYKLHKQSGITLVIISSDNNVTDIYFHTDENILDCNLKNDIVTFLSLLNNN